MTTEETTKAQGFARGLKLGEFQLREFSGLDAAFGADRNDYPDYATIPDRYKRRCKGAEVFSALFYGGGKLSDHGLALRDDVDAGAFYTTLRALMSSFAPQHEVKEATCAWLIEEHTVPA